MHIMFGLLLYHQMNTRIAEQRCATLCRECPQFISCYPFSVRIQYSTSSPYHVCTYSNGMVCTAAAIVYLEPEHTRPAEHGVQPTIATVLRRGGRTDEWMTRDDNHMNEADSREGQSPNNRKACVGDHSIHKSQASICTRVEPSVGRQGLRNRSRKLPCTIIGNVHQNPGRSRRSS